MEKLVSSWYNNVQPLPETYIFPPEARPGKLSNLPSSDNIPVIDLGGGGAQGHDRTRIVEQVLGASEEFGFFQEGYEADVRTRLKVRTSVRSPPSGAGDGAPPPRRLQQRPRPLPLPGESILFRFSGEITQNFKQSRSRRKLEKNGLAGEGKWSGTLLESSGVEAPVAGAGGWRTDGRPHFKPSADVFKEGEWIGVEPLPHGLVVNIGYQLQIISNGKLKCAEHRAVTNSTNARTSAAFFIAPSQDCHIQPATALINASNPKVYKGFQYKEFLSNYLMKQGNTKVVLVLEPFKL
ncbi:hypothetical protein ACLB2K_011587 [Fragaria x ananassa]